MKTGRRYLFICGCPRSGTTAMWKLLTASTEVVLGIERYGTLMFETDGGLVPELFEPRRFFAMHEGDTFYPDLHAYHAYYDEAAHRYATATTVGDKLPKLYIRFPIVVERFPGAKVVFLIRNIFDVAASYKKRAEDVNDATWRRDQGVDDAIRDWTQSIAAYTAFQERLDILPISYEALFIDGRGVERVRDFVGARDPQPIVSEYRNLLARSMELERERRRTLTASEVHEISMRAPFGGYRAIVDQATGATGKP